VLQSTDGAIPAPRHIIMYLQVACLKRRLEIGLVSTYRNALARKKYCGKQKKFPPPRDSLTTIGTRYSTKGLNATQRYATQRNATQRTPLNSQLSTWQHKTQHNTSISGSCIRHDTEEVQYSGASLEVYSIT
jgi:hypothetical protein